MKNSNFSLSNIFPVAIMGLIMFGMMLNLNNPDIQILTKLIVCGAGASMFFLTANGFDKSTKACALSLFLISLFMLYTTQSYQSFVHNVIISFGIGGVFGIYRPIAMLSNSSFFKKASD